MSGILGTRMTDGHRTGQTEMSVGPCCATESLELGAQGPLLLYHQVPIGNSLKMK